MTINFLEKDVQSQNRQTVYWFDVDGTTWGFAKGRDGGESLLDSEGFPMACNHEHVQLQALLSAELVAGGY